MKENELTDNYYILTADSRSTYCILKKAPGNPGIDKLLGGDFARDDWPADMRLMMDPEFKKRTRLADMLRNPDDLFIVSAKMAALLEKEGEDFLELLPVTILDQRKQVAAVDYFAVNVLTVHDCVDIYKSDVTWDPDNLDLIKALRHLILFEAKIDPKDRLFRAKYLPTTVFVRADLARAILAAGLEGVKIAQLDAG